MLSKKLLFKLVALVLVQSFLALDIAWSSSGQPLVSKQQDCLAAKLQISTAALEPFFGAGASQGIEEKTKEMKGGKGNVKKSWEMKNYLLKIIGVVGILVAIVCIAMTYPQIYRIDLETFERIAAGCLGIDLEKFERLQAACLASVAGVVFWRLISGAIKVKDRIYSWRLDNRTKSLRGLLKGSTDKDALFLIAPKSMLNIKVMVRLLKDNSTSSSHKDFIALVLASILDQQYVLPVFREKRNQWIISEIATVLYVPYEKGELDTAAEGVTINVVPKPDEQLSVLSADRGAEAIINTAI